MHVPNSDQARRDEAQAQTNVGVLAPGLESPAVEALVASHADYPSFRRVFRDPERRERALRSLLAATLRDATRSGVVRTAAHGSRLVAVNVWLPPGAFPWSARRKLRAVPYLLRVLRAGPRQFGTFMRYGANAERAHPTDHHWYLVVAGVHPDAQRQGLGSRLLRLQLELADREGAPVYLETADWANVAFYERFGFTVTDDALELVPGGPTHAAMRRPPSR